MGSNQVFDLKHLCKGLFLFIANDVYCSSRGANQHIDSAGVHARTVQTLEHMRSLDLAETDTTVK